MSFVLKTVMDAIADQLNTVSAVTEIAGRAVGYPIEIATPPAATVGYPTTFEYDFTAHGLGTTGKIRAVFPVRIIVGRALDRLTRDGVSDILTGSPGVAESLGGNLGGAVDTCNVNTIARFEVENIGGVDYQVVVFELEVIG